MGYRSRHKIVTPTSQKLLATAASGAFSGEVFCWMGLSTWTQCPGNFQSNRRQTNGMCNVKLKISPEAL